MLKVYDLVCQAETHYPGSLNLPNQLHSLSHSYSSPVHVATTLYRAPSHHGLSGLPTSIFVSL